MAPLKFNFDSENEFLIWTYNDEPIAFVINDLPELIGCLYALLSGSQESYVFSREKYGVFKAEAHNDDCRLYGSKGYYLCSKDDFNRIVEYLKKCFAEERIIYTNDNPPESTSSESNFFKMINWDEFLNKVIRILPAMILGKGIDDIFFD